MNLLKPVLFVFGVLFCMSGYAQLTSQKKYGVGGSITGELITLDLKGDGVLLLNSAGRILRLDNNYDTVWVKAMPDFFITDALLNAENNIILTGEKNGSVVPGYINKGVQVLKIDLNGNFINAGFKFIEMVAAGSAGQTYFPSIVEYKANSYILTVSYKQGQLISHILKLDNNFNVIENKKAGLVPGSTLETLLPRNRLVKYNDTAIIIYPRIFFDFYAFYANYQNSFAVIDTSLNNTCHKQLDDPLRKINSVAVAGNDVFIGGNMMSDKLIHNQFDNGLYVNSYLTKVNISNAASYDNRSLLFCQGYIAKSLSFQTDFFLFGNSFYSTTFGVGSYNTDNNLINDSLSKNFRTRVTKLDTSLQIQWNKRMHIFGTKDTTLFQSNGLPNDFFQTKNVLINKSNQLLNFSSHQAYNSTGNVLPSEIGFSAAAIDTSGNNATCHATDEDFLYKYDSLRILDNPVLNYVPDTVTLVSSFQSIVNIPLNQISDICLPLVKAKSKFYWQPVTSYGFDTLICKDSKLRLHDRSYNEPKTWHWIFPPQADLTDLDSLYLPDVNSISFSQAGVFPVSLVTTNDAGSDTTTQYITVINFIPQPNLGNDTAICNGDSIRLIYTDPPNSAHYFMGPYLFSASDTLIIKDSGQYIIAAYTACGILYDTINIKVAFKPAANFGFTAGCNNLTVSFTDSSMLNGNPGINYQYDWKPALAPATAYTTFSIQANNNYTFAAYDSFDIRLIIRSPLSCGQQDTIVKRIVLKAKPVAACTAVNNCGSLLAAFTSTATIAAGTIAQQEYYVGNALIGTGAGFTYSFAAYGSYVVKQVVKSNFNCISDTFLLPVVIKDKPQVNLITVRDSACNSSSYSITANAAVNASTITSYAWLKNNVPLANNTNTITETNAAGIYTYKLVATSAEGCASDTAVKIITVAGKPTAVINAANNCGSKSITISASSAVVNDAVTIHYINYGDGNSAAINPNSTSYTYANYGTYTLKYLVQSSVGCTSDTVYHTIVVKDKPAVTISYNNNACQNTNYLLTANATVNASSITSYTWLKNGTLLANNSSTLTENNAAGSYTYKLAVTSAQGCLSDTAVQTVTAEKYPTTLFTAAGGCAGKPIVITNSSVNNNAAGSLQYLWTTSDGQTSTAVTPAFSFAAGGNKTIQLTASSQNGCATGVAKTIRIDDYPVAAFDITEACMGKNITISNKSTGVITSYAWQTSNAQQSSSPVPQFIFNTPGNYSITLQVSTANNCSAAITKNTSIQPVQLFTTPATDTNAVTGQPVQLNVTGAVTYTWQPAANLSNANSSNPVFTSLVTGVYPLAAEGTDAQGCKGNATLLVKVFAAGNYLFIPNAFTPNGDGLNDQFRIVCSGLKELNFFTVHNRYGQMLYRQNSCSTGGWDGNFNGIAQPLGAYVYSWQGIDFTGKIVSGKGSVMLVR